MSTLARYRDEITAHHAVRDSVVQAGITRALLQCPSDVWAAQERALAVLYLAAHYVELDRPGGEIYTSPLVAPNGDSLDMTRYGKAYKGLRDRQARGGPRFFGLV